MVKSGFKQKRDTYTPRSCQWFSPSSVVPRQGHWWTGFVMDSEPDLTCGWDTPLFLFLSPFTVMTPATTGKLTVQCGWQLFMYFSVRGNNQMQTYTSNIKLGPETQNTRVSAPQSNGLALPPAAFLHTKYQVLEMYIPWARAHTGPKHSGCSAHTHKQRPVQAPCGAESMWELAAPGADVG